MQAAAPEFDLLVECLRRSLLGTPPSEPLAVPEHLDWMALQTLARQHVVIPLVFPYLAPVAPAHAAQPLAVGYHSSWAYAQSLATDLTSVLDAFAQAGIECMPFKGPVLAEALFGDVAARASLDIDILVQPADHAAAQSVLVAIGFIADLLPRFASKQAHDFPFYRDNVRVELHSSFGRPSLCPIDSNQVWARSQPGVFRGYPIRVMTMEDSALYLSYHLLRHDCERLQWIADLARTLTILAQRDSGDLLVQCAENQNLNQLLLFASALASQALRTPLPAAISSALHRQPRVSAKAARFLEEGLRKQSLTGSPRKRTFPVTWSFYSPERSLLSRWVRRLRELAPSLSDREWAESKHIPAWLIPPLLPFLRFVRILGNYGLAGAWRNFMQGTR